MPQRTALATATIALLMGAGGVAVPTSAQAAATRPAAQAAATRPAAKPSATRPAATLPAARNTATYPYARSSPAKADPWGAGIRQCTSFASWWLSTHGIKINRSSQLRGPRGTARLANAGHWDAAAKQAGYTVSGKPVVGAIAQWHGNERSTWPIPGGYTYVVAGADGHVAVVRKVYADGSALIEDYNGAVPLGVHTFRGKAPRYLLIHA